MTSEIAMLTVAAYLQREFGRLLETRDMRPIRRVSGLAWSVRVVVAGASGDVHVASLEVDEGGDITPQLGPDDVIRALRRVSVAASRRSSLDADPIDAIFAELASSSEHPDDADPGAVSVRVRSLIAQGDDASMLEARALLPRLLADADRRGGVLLVMADTERKLGHDTLALHYLEAAAREFADQFDVVWLERAAAMALDLAGEDAFLASPLHALLERCRARLVPLASPFDSPELSVADAGARAAIARSLTLHTYAPGDALVVEGAPSRSLFIIKSGVVAVILEGPTPRRVRCCFPGWLLGESSVLARGDPRCTATLRAEQVTEVWQISAAAMLPILRESPALQARIAETKSVHRLDSFFSMHEAVGQLDAEVRDAMLRCLQSIVSFSEATVLVPPDTVPAVACLVARGEIALHEGWDIDAPPVEIIGADRFVFVREVLHGVPSSRSVVARPGSTVAFFDGDRLRALVEEHREDVATVLERLS